MKKLLLIVNGETALEYDRETTLDEDKLAFLDSMDKDMDKGIKIYGELINQPDAEQRARFITLNLIKALQQDNHAIIQVSCAYLATRMPALNEVQVSDGEGKIDIVLVEDVVN